MSREFELIRSRFIGQGGPAHAGSVLGIGDDASLHRLERGMELVISTDTSVAGVHWPDDFPLANAADRAVCAALSDLAAMGAAPLATWLNVMAIDSDAVETMAEGTTRALSRYGVELAGGDTCRAGVNALAVTVAGEVPQGMAMRRDRAVAGDTLWLAGRVGFSALGLQQWLAGDRQGMFVSRFETVEPLLQIGMRLREAGVRCCIDISDGLLQDAGHIATASGVAIAIDAEALPDWEHLCEAVGEQAALRAAAAGGEDYALLFSAPATMTFPAEIAVAIGSCQAGSGVTFRRYGRPVTIDGGGFDHFG